MARQSRARGASYPVGYGKPPAATRFRPGQSGNPRGRPRAAAPPDPSLEGLNPLHAGVLKAMAEPVTLSVGGRAVRVAGGEALARALLAQALEGRAQSARLLLQLRDEAEARAEEVAAQSKHRDGSRGIVLFALEALRVVTRDGENGEEAMRHLRRAAEKYLALPEREAEDPAGADSGRPAPVAPVVERHVGAEWEEAPLTRSPGAEEPAREAGPAREIAVRPSETRSPQPGHPAAGGSGREQTPPPPVSWESPKPAPPPPRVGATRRRSPDEPLIVDRRPLRF